MDHYPFLNTMIKLYMTPTSNIYDKVTIFFGHFLIRNKFLIESDVNSEIIDFKKIGDSVQIEFSRNQVQYIAINTITKDKYIICIKVKTEKYILEFPLKWFDLNNVLAKQQELTKEFEKLFQRIDHEEIGIDVDYH